jgi:hypothetical protein
MKDPKALILDCPYKQNCFGLPILNIARTTGLGTSLYLAFAFIKAEAESDFSWALQQLHKILPCAP